MKDMIFPFQDSEYEKDTPIFPCHAFQRVPETRLLMSENVILSHRCYVYCKNVK